MDQSNHLESFILWFCLLCIFITTPIFLLVLYTIARKLKSAFDSGFWRIFLSLGLANLLHSWGDVITRLMAMGYFGHKSTNDIWAKIIMINHWFSNFSQTTGVALMSFNRFLNIFQPQWPWALRVKSSNGLVELLVQWVSSLALVTPMFLMDFKFVPIWNGTGYTAAETSDRWAAIYYPLHGTKLCVEVCLHLAFYSAMLHKATTDALVSILQQILQIKGTLQAGGNSNDYEKRLTIAGLFIGSLTSINACCSVIMIMLDSDDLKPAQLVLLDTVDMVVAMSQPYILLALSDLLRQHMPLPCCPTRARVAPAPRSRSRLATWAQKSAVPTNRGVRKNNYTIGNHLCVIEV